MESTVVSSRIDWVTASRSLTHLSTEPDYKTAAIVSANMLRQLLPGSVELASDKPSRGYRLGFIEKNTGVRVSLINYSDPRGMLITASGKALSSLDYPSMFLLDLLNEHFKVTRLDLAVDVYYGGVTAGDIATMLENKLKGKVMKRKRGFFLSQSGGTFYLGSRSSNRYLRIYDKGRKEKTLLDWLRLEIELKGELAHRHAEIYKEMPTQFVYEIINMVGLPESVTMQTLEQYVHDVSYQEIKPTPVKHDREAWLHNQVLPAFRRLLKENEGAALRFLDALLHEVKAHDGMN